MKTLQRALVIAGATTALVAGSIAASLPASAHSIIDLTGATAYAGKTSKMTMEIQHGCMPSQPTNKVVTFFKASFGDIVPLKVKGWTSTTGVRPNGRKYVIWQTTTAPQPFANPLYLPMRITWPTKAGEYGMPTRQFCVGGGSWFWQTQWQPASADVPSPPVEPLPSVMVLKP
jgi:hypothetical protein